MRIARRNVVLAGALVTLTGLLVFGGREAAPTRAITRLFPTLTTASAARLELAADGRSVRVERVNGEWVLPDLFGYPAEPLLVARVIERLGSLTSLDLLTEDPKRHAEYGLDEGAAQRFTVFDVSDGVLADLLVARAPTGAAYVRLRGQDAVFGAGALPTTSSDLQAWRLGSPLITVDATLATRIELAPADAGAGWPSVTVVRDPDRYDRWFDGEGSEVPRERVERLLNELVKLYPLAILAAGPAPEHGLDPAALTVRVVGAKGEVALARIGAAQGGRDANVAAQGALGPWVVQVRGTAVERLRAVARALTP
ncbi:MAG: DUF4340 domain-containing protein [Planctomycetota bacterium]